MIRRERSGSFGVSSRGGMPSAWYIVPGNFLPLRLFNSLHWPYLLWHLSYVALGAALAPHIRWDVLAWSIAAFFFGMGISSHMWDLRAADPLALGLPSHLLDLLGVLGLAAALSIGALNIAWGNVGWWLAVAMPIGIVMALGYGLEWPGLHGGTWQFPIFWAVFPFIVSYLAQTPTWTWLLFPMGIFAFLTAWAQRVLSTRARALRRGKIWLGSDSATAWALAPLDRALAIMSFAMPLLAAGLLLA